MTEGARTMSDSEKLLELRELFLSSSVSLTTQVVTIVVSLALAGLVLWLVRRRRLGEEYTPIWLIVAFVLVVICLNYAVRLSRTSVQIKNLTQEIALLKARLEGLGG
jgi:cell division protein FtsW (lipid II flippase)